MLAGLHHNITSFFSGIVELSKRGKTKKRKRLSGRTDAPIGATVPHQEIRWSYIQLVFLRCVAFVCLLRALGLSVGLFGVTAIPFEGLSPFKQGYIIVFTIGYAIAAVGSWLPAPWGAALWLLLFTAELILPFFHAELALSFFMRLIYLGFIVLYFVLAWFVHNREREW